jgi:hypothetical protein
VLTHEKKIVGGHDPVFTFLTFVYFFLLFEYSFKWLS